MTGGTGFVGCSFIERFDQLAPAGSRLTILSRDPEAFASREPELASRTWLSFEKGDVLSLPRSLGRFDGIIHAAASSDAARNERDPLGLIETIVRGTRNVLSFAKASGAIPVLFASSGAVYGTQPQEIERLRESHLGILHPVSAGGTYAEAKRAAELECVSSVEQDGADIKIARMFAFSGPHLPLRKHFAIGNFIGDVLDGRPIIIQGDGTAVRSYLDADDMVDWLWAIFREGKAGQAYNVGSERAHSIAELAQIVMQTAATAAEVQLLGRQGLGVQTNRYVPDTSKARSELGVKETIGLEASILRSIRFHRRRRGNLPPDPA